MRSTVLLAAAFVFVSVAVAAETRPTSVVRLVSGGERIPTVRAARGLTTMLTLPEEAREAICGDLYDPQSGNGGFVIQRSGCDLFLKPLRASGSTNLFVKTDRSTYAFELVVVPASRAMRIVRVEPAPGERAEESALARLERDRAALEADRAALSRERAESESAIARRREELEREAAARAERLAREWVEASVRDGASCIPVARRDARSRDLEVTLGDAALVIPGHVFLRCAVRNRGHAPATIASVELGAGRVPVAEVVPPGGAVTLVVAIAHRPARDAPLRLLDPAGAVLVSFRPFR